MQQEKQKKAGQIYWLVSMLVLLSIFILLPAFSYGNFYKNSMIAKSNCYNVIGGLGFAGIFVTLLYNLVHGKYSKGIQKPVCNLLDGALLLLGLVTAVSLLFTTDPILCLSGKLGNCVGTYMVLSLIVLFYFVSRGYDSKRFIGRRVFSICAGIMYFWIVCNAFHLDLFFTHAKLKETEFFHYLGGLGEIPAVTAYLCLTLPFLWVYMVNETERKNILVDAVLLFFGLLAFFLIQTDGLWLGAMVFALFAIPYMFGSMPRLIRSFYVFFEAGVVLCLLSILSLIPGISMIKDTGWSVILVKYWIGVPLVFLSLFALWLFKYKKVFITKKLRKRVAFAGSLLVLAVLFAYVIYSILHFSDLWGAFKGRRFSSAVKLWQSYPVENKLFGLGTEMFSEYLSAFFSMGLFTIVNCHNNVLNCLLSLGVLGVIAYFLVWIALILPYFGKRREKWSHERMACFLSLVAYLGQSFFGDPYPSTIPMLFMVAAIYQNQALVQKKKERAKKDAERKEQMKSFHRSVGYKEG